ncbi:hypothetical protein [Stenotrophomonas sp. STK17_22]|uniref:hypothetical protein n=1 Tax=Stenotrophomonas sp. STK17_22 TaxID=3455201 RepID=UPI003F7D9D5E
MNLLQSGFMRTLACVAAATGIWLIAAAANNSLDRLPVHQAAQVDQASSPMVVKAIFPVWVESAVGNSEREGQGDIDLAFGKRNEQKEELARPNYAEILRPSVRVAGISSNGAFVNGQFYSVGSRILALATVGEGGDSVVPRLIAARSDRVVIDVAGDALVFLPGANGWH